MLAAGYSRKEAADSAAQCDDMACLLVNAEQAERQAMFERTSMMNARSEP